MFSSCSWFLLFSSGLSAAHSGWVVVLVPGIAAAGSCTPLLTSPLALLSKDGGCVWGSPDLLQAPFQRSHLTPTEANTSSWTESVVEAGPTPSRFLGARWLPPHATGEWGGPALSIAGVNTIRAGFSELHRGETNLVPSTGSGALCRYKACRLRPPPALALFVLQRCLLAQKLWCI